MNFSGKGIRYPLFVRCGIADKRILQSQRTAFRRTQRAFCVVPSAPGASRGADDACKQARMRIECLAGNKRDFVILNTDILVENRPQAARILKKIVARR